MRWLILPLLVALAAPAAAQSTTFRWVPGQEVVLAADVREGVTIRFEPGETIARISMVDEDAFAVDVHPSRESVLLRAGSPDARTQLDLFTDRRFYRFRLSASAGVDAVQSARLDTSNLPGPPPVALAAAPTAEWNYEIKGDQEVRPVAVQDDGERTTITYGADQPLPAVFAIGPTGEEEVVNGHMREDGFVIDRVYDELIFRIDRKKARALRKAVAEERL